MLITYGPGNTALSPAQQAQHRAAFAAYWNGALEVLADCRIRGERDSGRFVGYDYANQVWVEVDFYAPDPKP